MDYLEKYKTEIAVDEIFAIRKNLEKKFSSNNFESFRNLQKLEAVQVSEHVLLDQPHVVIGREDEISFQQKEILYEQLKIFMPWRKGPFRLFGIEVDGEWRSDFKWQRIVPHLDDLHNKKVADVGCNNGYFLFRMAHFKPQLAIGFDPTYRFQQNFSFLLKHTTLNNLFFELLGFEHLSLYKNFFDVLLNLGVLYHHSDPLVVLKNSYEALKKGGQIVVDSLTIDEQTMKALYPGTRYAGMRNVHFIPSNNVLKEMMRRAGFHHIELIYEGEVSEQEQRSGQWATGKSLADIRSQENPSLTQEGYPMPRRTYLVGRK